MQHRLAELIALVGNSNVRRFHQFFASPPNTFRDGFADTLQRRGGVCEDNDVKEEESTGHDFAFSKSFLRCIFALLCHVFDAGVGAVVVMIELMQCSKVSSKAESKLVGILDDVCT